MEERSSAYTSREYVKKEVSISKYGTKDTLEIFEYIDLENESDRENQVALQLGEADQSSTTVNSLEERKFYSQNPVESKFLGGIGFKILSILKEYYNLLRLDCDDENFSLDCLIDNELDIPRNLFQEIFSAYTTKVLKRITKNHENYKLDGRDSERLFYGTYVTKENPSLTFEDFKLD